MYNKFLVVLLLKNEQLTTAVRGIMVAPTTERRPDHPSYGVNAFTLDADCFVSKMSEV